MEQKNTTPKPESERKQGQSGPENVLSDKEKFEHSEADEAIKRMGEKTREANKDK
jgi:hypothetical protein